MSMQSAVATAAVMEPQTSTTYQRVPYNFPGVGIWIPTTENDGSEAGKRELQKDEERKSTASFFERLKVKATSASIRRPKVSPQPRSSKKNGDVQLTKLEKQYLDYLRRSVGTGQFSHYVTSA
ncbi:unnamed protein product [Calypogeia fissa]